MGQPEKVFAHEPRVVALLDISLLLVAFGLVVSLAYAYTSRPYWTADPVLAIVPIWLVVRGWKSRRWWLRDLATVMFFPAILVLIFTFDSITREYVPITMFR